MAGAVAVSNRAKSFDDSSHSYYRYYQSRYVTVFRVAPSQRRFQLGTSFQVGARTEIVF